MPRVNLTEEELAHVEARRARIAPIHAWNEAIKAAQRLCERVGPAYTITDLHADIGALLKDLPQ